MYDPDVSHPLASVGWGDKKKVVGSDGTIYNSKDDMPADVTPVALILYVGSDTYNDTYTHGLAVAWADENDGATMTFEAAKAAIEGKTAVPGGKWKLL